MKKHRILLALLLVLALVMSSFAAAADETYPTEWDLTEIYADVDAWQTDYDKVMAMIPQFESFRGTLNSAQGVYDYLQFACFSEMVQIQNRLSLYANLGYNLNPSDPVYSTLMSKLSAMGSELNQAGAFVDEEIFALPLETRQEIFSDPLLAPWAYAFEDYTDPNCEPFSEETQTALAILEPAMGRSKTVFDILCNVDRPSPVVTMPDGTEAELTDELYNSILFSNEYDRDFKAECNQLMLTKTISFANTFAALLEETVATNWAYAQLNGYETSREAAMADNDLDPAIYDMVIEAARQGAPDYQRYLDIHRRAFGLDVQYPFEAAVCVSRFNPGAISYEEAVSEVREALSVLGEDYLGHYDKLITSSHMDVYPSDTKVSGAFSVNIGNEFLPFMLLNYSGYSSDVSTLAHEMGHSLYSYYAAENQDAIYSEPSAFTHEVTSTTNQLLYYVYKMENAATDDEKLFYLENLLNMFIGTFFLQSLYSEFEDAMYQTVEQGGSLDAEALSDLWFGLYQTYRGDTVKEFPDFRYQWSLVPHFHYNYYVYQYATAIAYAASICEQITGGVEGAVDNYLVFLKLGSSEPPCDLLAVAGVDPLDSQTYQNALNFFSDLVDEYERLVDAAPAEK